MHTSALLAVSGALLTAVVAVPMKRDVVYETHTQEVVQTVAVTATVWVDATDSPVPHMSHAKTSEAEKTTAAVPSNNHPQSSSTSVYVAPTSVVVVPSSSTPAAPSAPATTSIPVHVPSTTSSSVYVAPTTSVPAPPPPSSPPAQTPSSTPTYSAPATSSSAASSSPGGQKYTGDITYYTPGLGSCGGTNTESDFIVALAAGMMDKATDCNRAITISYAGSTQQAKIVDTCPGCSGAGLDLSPALFKAVAPNGDGRVHGVEWWFN